MNKEYLEKYIPAGVIRLCVIILTCDRSKHIDHWIGSQGENFDKHGIDIIIYDSSSGTKTESVVEKYTKKGIGHLFYKRYDGVFDGVSLDHKWLDAVREFAPRYDYIWPCRDGLIINIDKIYNELLLILHGNCDIVIVENPEFSPKARKTGSRIYTDCFSFCSDWFMESTVMGLSIFKNEFILEIIRVIPLDDKTYTMYPAAAMFHYVVDHAFKSVSFVDFVYSLSPLNTGASHWNKSGNALWQFTKRWFELVDQLPRIYDPIKPDLFKKERYGDLIFSYQMLMQYKNNGGLKLGDIKKYKQYIRLTANKPLYIFYVISMCPRPLLKIIYKTCKRIRNLILTGKS
jgi:hypothetical protein